MPDLVCLGEPMIEFNRQPAGADGRVFWLEGHGGDTSNCAIAAARQGVSAAYISSIGADPFGDSLMRLWAEEGVDTSAVFRHAEAPTGIYFVTHSERGHEFTFARAGSAASRMTPADIPRSAIASARAFETSAITQAIGPATGEAVLHAMAVARQHGVWIAYDTNLRLRLWPLERALPAIEEACAHADLVFTSDEEARMLWGFIQPDAVCDRVMGWGVSTVVVKCGAAGALVATRKARRHIAGHKVTAVDATGAGDTFAGAFLARQLEGDDVFEAARYANAAAALKTLDYGAVRSIPRPDAVRALLAKA